MQAPFSQASPDPAPASRPARFFRSAGSCAWLFAPFALTLLLYWLLRQPSLAYDGAMYIYLAAYDRPVSMPHHVVFSRLLWLFIQLGELLGWSRHAAASFQSAALMAASAALFFAMLRRVGCAASIAFAYAALYAVSHAALENGTQVELYGASMAAVAWSFLLFCGEADPTRPRSRFARYGLFPFACALVPALHIGFAAWVAAMFATLMFRERRDFAALRRRCAQLALCAALLALAYLRGRQINSHALHVYEDLFSTFWNHQHGWGIVRRLLEAPATDFGAYAGMVLFPAVLGLRLFARRLPAHALHLALCSVAFVGYYAFWPVDLGSFYLPLQLAWGLFAALGTQAVLRQPGRRHAVLFIALLLATALLCYPLHVMRIGLLSGTALRLCVAGFYALLAFQGFVWSRWIALHAALPLAPRLRPAGLVAFALALLFAVFSFGPVVRNGLVPDRATLQLRALQKILPPPGWQRTRLITAIKPTSRPFAEIGVDPIGYPSADPALWREVWFDAPDFEQWLRETALPHDQPKLFADAQTYRILIEAWPVSIPLDQVRFDPITSEDFEFYEVHFTPPD